MIYLQCVYIGLDRALSKLYTNKIMAKIALGGLSQLIFAMISLANNLLNARPLMLAVKNDP